MSSADESTPLVRNSLLTIPSSTAFPRHLPRVLMYGQTSWCDPSTTVQTGAESEPRAQGLLHLDAVGGRHGLELGLENGVHLLGAARARSLAS